MGAEVTPVEQNESVPLEGKASSFGLYIHWPFCLSKCPYCDFNSHVRDSIDIDLWQEALLRELAYTGRLTSGRRLTSVFFGGGTPSLMPPSLVEALLNSLPNFWDLASDLEITLEANPNSVEVSRLKGFRQAGVNRLSMGIQSLRQESLSFLGRQHSVQEAIKALEVAKKTFDRFSFDLIYARPEQTVPQWEQELKEAMTLAGDHLSLYQLTIEKGTAFYAAHQRGDWLLPEESLAADLYEATAEMMKTAGLPGYEISNYAKPGSECAHNLVYWRTQDYAGIGPGAHGRLTLGGETFSTRTHRGPEVWLDTVLDSQKTGSGWVEQTELLPETLFWDSLLMGLRLKEGVPWARLYQCDSNRAKSLKQSDKLAVLKEEGLISDSDQGLCVTKAGFPKLNALLAYLV